MWTLVERSTISIFRMLWEDDAMMFRWVERGDRFTKEEVQSRTRFFLEKQLVE